jgi:hypothetical protein
MNTIRIGTAQRRLEDTDSQWIHEQLEARRREGANTCVRVTIKIEGADVALETVNCLSRPGARREPNALERSLFDLWERSRLREANFTSGNLAAFVQQVRRLI